MLRFLQKRYLTVQDAANAVIEQISGSEFPWIESIEIFDFFVMEGARFGERTSFEIYCVVEVTPKAGHGTEVRMAIVINAEKWPSIVNYTILGENQGPLSADAPPHILAQLDPPLLASGKQWRERCAQGPRWSYNLEIDRMGGEYTIRVLAEREFKSHIVIELPNLRQNEIAEIVEGLKHDYPGIELPVSNHRRSFLAGLSGAI